MATAKGVLRPLKSGGFSYCKSPEHLVGKGRCNHIPGMSFSVSRNDNGASFVQIANSENSKENDELKELKTDLKALNKYMQELDKAITEEKKQKIINYFKTHNM